MPGRFKDVQDQVIVITGASSGIGLATRSQRRGGVLTAAAASVTAGV